MNAVATSKIATILNLRAESERTAGAKEAKMPFKQILDDKRAQTSVSRRKNDHHEDPANLKTKAAKETKTEYEKRALSKADDDTKIKAKVSDALGEGVEVSDETDLLKELSELMGTDAQTLSEIMASLNLSITDLKSQEGLQTLLNAVLGVNGESDLLLDENLFLTYKEMKASVEQLVEQKVVDSEEVDANESLVQSISLVNTETEQAATPVQNQTSSTSTQADHPVEEVFQVEVKDLRKEKSSNGDGDKNSSGEGKFNNLFQLLDEAVKSKGLEATPGTKQEYQQIGTKALLNQIVNNVKVVLTDEVQSMSFQLHPENLGKLSLTVSTDKGSITGKITAENVLVKEAIEINLLQLKASLNEQGIKVDKIEVAVASTNQFTDQNNQNGNMNQSSQNKRRKIVNMEVVEGMDTRIPDFSESIGISGITEPQSSVNFSA